MWPLSQLSNCLGTLNMHFFHLKKVKQLSVPSSMNVAKYNIYVNFPHFTILCGYWGLGAGGGLLLFLLSFMHFTALVKYQHLTAKSLKGDYLNFFKK